MTQVTSDMFRQVAQCPLLNELQSVSSSEVASYLVFEVRKKIPTLLHRIGAMVGSYVDMNAEGGAPVF